MSDRSIQLGTGSDETAPDGSAVRRLVRLQGASMAHFTFPSGQISAAVRHRSIDELWFVTSGSGELWLSDARGEEVIALTVGTSVAIACGAAFQVRADTDLEIVGVAVPPWPGDAEAESVVGRWEPA